MVVALVVVGVVALALVVVVFVLRHRLSQAATLLVDSERRLVLADERAEKAESETRSADARRTTAEDRASELEAGLEAAKVQVGDAEAARDDATIRAETAEQQAVIARDAGARVIEAAALRADAGGLWFLEALRIERRWRATLGAPDAPLFDGDGEPAVVALGAVTEVIREESGTSFDIDWQVEEPVPPALTLAVVRASDELLSALSIASDGGALEVSPVADGIRLTLRVDPEPELPPELLAVFGVLGWEVGGDHGTPRALTLTIPFEAPDAR